MAIRDRRAAAIAVPKGPRAAAFERPGRAITGFSGPARRAVTLA